ncbi:hypothetical protein [Rhodopirellula sp. P2]|uniref:hypothetical protein n=1 Tax=Rhodopirellula sp. P2 TaxID=2127060 RepID=UPI003FD0D176
MVEQAGIWKHVTSHMFRHRFATHLLWQGTGNRSRDAARRSRLGTQTFEDKCSPLVPGSIWRSCSFTTAVLARLNPPSWTQLGRGGMRASSENSGEGMRAVSHARPSPSRTPERRRSTSRQTSFRERYTMWKSAEKRNQKTARAP